MEFENFRSVRRPFGLKSLPALAVGVAFATQAGSALAVPYTYTSAADGLWSDGTNWTPTGVPGAGDTATIGDAAANRTVTYDAAAPATLGVVNLTEASAFANRLAFVQSPTAFTSITVSHSTAAATAALRLVDAANLAVGTGSTLQFGSGTASDFGGTVLDRSGTAAGTLAVNGGTLLATSGNTTTAATYTVAAPVTLSSGAINLTGPATGTARTSLQLTGPTFTMSGGTLSIAANTALDLSGVTTSTFTNAPAQSITLGDTASLTYSTNKAIDQTLLNAISSSSGAGFLIGTKAPTSTATLDLTNAGNVSLGLTLGGTYASTIVLTPNNNTYRFGGGAGIVTVQGALLTGARSLVVAGGRVNLGSSNASYTGSTTVNDGGILVESAVGRVLATSALAVNGTGVFDLGVNAAGKTATFASLTGTGTLDVRTAGSLSTTLQINGAASTAFSGQINDGSISGATVAFTKAGAGLLTLSGTNGYTGATSVSGGALIVNGAITSSAVTVAGGTLSGTGTAGGTVAVTTGTIAAGNTAGSGTLSVGSLTLGASATDVVALNGTAAGQYSQLLVTTGATAVNGTLQLAVNYAAQIGDTFSILQDSVGNTGLFSGVFANVTSVTATTGTLTTGGYTFAVNYLPTAVTLSVTATGAPEPATLGLLGLGSMLLVRRRRV